MEQRPLHWSERAKMFPAPPGSAGLTSAAQRNPKQPRDKPPRGGRSGRGSTGGSRRGFLIVLLILLVAAAAVAASLLWPRGEEDSGGEADLNARSLVRQAMTAIDKAYTEARTFDPQSIPPSTLQAIAASVTFLPLSDTSAATSPTARAVDKAVNYAGTQTSYAVGTVSANGTAYGVVVDTSNDTRTYYLNGLQVADWEQAPATTPQNAPATQTDQTTQTTSQSSQGPTGPISAATDLEAMTLVRDSMTAIESAYASVGTFEPSVMTADLLQQLQPSTTFVVRDSNEAATAPVGSATEKTVDFYGTTTSYALGTTSDSGKSFGVVVSKDGSGRTSTYYVSGQVQDWSSQLFTPVVGYRMPEAGLEPARA